MTMYSIKQTDLIGETNIPEEYYDLLTCIIIRRGKESENKDIFDFLNGLFEGDIPKLEEYSHIKWDDTFVKEVETMTGFGDSLYQKGITEGKAETRKEMLIAAFKGGVSVKQLVHLFGATEEEIQECEKEARQNT